MKDNCFTILHWFLPCINMNQPYKGMHIYMYTYIGIGIHMYIAIHMFLLAERWFELPESTVNFHWLSVLHIVRCMFPGYSFQSSHPLLPTLCPQVCSLCLHLHCCPANRFMNTIFLGCMYTCMHFWSADFARTFFRVYCITFCSIGLIKDQGIQGLNNSKPF